MRYSAPSQLGQIEKGREQVKEQLEQAIKERELWGSTDLYEIGYLDALKRVLTDLEGENK